MDESNETKTIKVNYKFDEDTINKIKVIRSYMKKKYGIDTDTSAVKAAVHYMANDIEENKV